MRTEDYNLYSIILSAISLLATITGLVAVYYQIQKIRLTTWSTVHSKLTDQSFELLKLLNQEDDTYEYFYENKQLVPGAYNETTIKLIAEAFANFMEHLILQKENLPKQQWQVWDRFIRSTLKNSAIVKEFITDHPEWYCQALVEISKG